MKLGYISILFIGISCTGLALADSIPETVVPCTANQCPGISDILNANEALRDQAIVFQTSPQREFLSRSIKQFSATHNGGWQRIIINELDFADSYPIIGFGGAFTDSASMLYQHMQPALKKYFIDSYYSPHGLAYSLGRVPIASTDFSCRKLEHLNDEDIGVPSLKDCSNVFSCYSYADTKDEQLTKFALQPEDVEFKIPMIHAATQANQQHSLRLFASPWSAPAWMKTNGSMVHGSLNAKYQQVWADYIVKFLQAYKNKQIIFWGVTVENEPNEDGIGRQYQNWQTMYLTQEQEAGLIKDYLGPTLQKFSPQYGSKIHLMMHDDQIPYIQDRVTMLNDFEVGKYVDGVALHWYSNFDIFYANLDTAYQIINSNSLDKKRFILGTEACEGYMPISRGPSFGSWSRGESYAHDIMSDINHHVSGWTDWNLVLDLEGGPNWAKNYVDAPILVDLSKQTFYRQPMFYFFGHFSKFIRPDSLQIASQSQGPSPLEQVAFRVPAYDKLPETIVVVVLNRDITGRNYYLRDDSMRNEKQFLNMHIPAHSIQTIIYRARELVKK